MITLRCTNCQSEIEHDGQYDENIEESITCHYCGWTVAKWAFEYIKDNNKEADNDGGE